MTTNTDEYVPNDDDERIAHADAERRHPVSSDQPYVYPQDSRTVPFSANDFGSQWALFRGRVFKVNDLTPFHREWEEWLAAHDARVRQDAAKEALIEFRRTELATIPPNAKEDDPIRTRQQALAWRIEMHLRGNYSKETP